MSPRLRRHAVCSNCPPSNDGHLRRVASAAGEPVRVAVNHRWRRTLAAGFPASTRGTRMLLARDSYATRRVTRASTPLGGSCMRRLSSSEVFYSVPYFGAQVFYAGQMRVTVESLVAVGRRRTRPRRGKKLIYRDVTTLLNATRMPSALPLFWQDSQPTRAGEM